MAIFIPDLKPDDFNNSLGEKDVYESFLTLNDSYTIFYSLQWVGIGERTIGEADFIVFHPEKGISVIEVKAGGIDYKNGRWIQTNTKTGKKKTIHPFSQARRSKYEVLERLEKADLGFRLPMVCYCSWFPSINVAETVSLPPEASREITLDITDLKDPEVALTRMFNYWEEKERVSTSLDNLQSQKVVDVLCPYLHLVPKLKYRFNELNQSYIQLTNQQTMVLDFLQEQPTAVINGLAGTGKTVIAVEKAKRLAEQGESVLFLCYNAFLRDVLKANNVIPGVVFHNIHSLAYEIMGQSDSPIDEVVNEFEDYLEIVFDSNSWKYKNIIVDEGQDLDDRLLQRLYELVKQKQGCFYVFYDKNQFVNPNELPQWIDNAECRLVLSKNCRNTVEVCKTSCGLIGLSKDQFNDVHGDTPKIKFYKTVEELESIVDSFISAMTKEDIPAEEIAVLTVKSVENSKLDISRKYGGKYLSLKREPGKVLFSTVRRFKGLEASAILLIDCALSSLKYPDQQRLMYVGSSRAKNYLNIAMVDDTDDMQEMGTILKALNPDRNMPKNKKGLKRLLHVDL